MLCPCHLHNLASNSLIGRLGFELTHSSPNINPFQQGSHAAMVIRCCMAGFKPSGKELFIIGQMKIWQMSNDKSLFPERFEQLTKP
jgi:hypothetical protein